MSSSYYAVKNGMVPGIYQTWEECQAQTTGFRGAEYKKFNSEEEAKIYMNTKKVALHNNAMSSGGQRSLEQDIECLSLEQKYAYYKYRSGSNLFITGPGGTGKSYLIKTIKRDLVERNINHGVCAMTGCAAVLLNCLARTIHSWSGVGLCQGEVHEIVERAARNRKTIQNWKMARVLIVDEVSMMSQKMIEVLDNIGRVIRKCPEPFGGIQVIFIGDFYQLPPVGKRDEPETVRFCFESPIWKTTFSPKSHILLKTIFRHKDSEFVQILDEVRKGVITPESVKLLESRVSAQYDPAEHNGIVPTKLFPRNADAERINNSMYAKLTDEERVYDSSRHTRLSTYAETGQAIPAELLARCDFLKPEEVDQQLDLFEENNKLMKKLCLKKGAIVMCLANLDTDSGICNGSLGIVTDFVVQQFNGDGKSLSGPNIAPRVKFLNGVEMLIFPKLYQHGDYPRLGIQQVPLRLAWAFTIHKSQGVTLDLAQIDLGSNIFEYGQSYVGLSRMRSLDGLYLTGFNPNKIKTNPIVAEFYERIGTITEEMVAKLEERWKPMVSGGGGGTQSGTQSMSGGGTSISDPTTKVVFLG